MRKSIAKARFLRAAVSRFSIHKKAAGRSFTAFCGGIYNINQRFTRTFLRPVDKRRKRCYTVTVIKSSAEGGDDRDENLYLSDVARIAFGMPNVIFILPFLHIRSRVCFLFATKYFATANIFSYAPFGCFLFFTKSPRYISGVMPEMPKGEF